MKNTQIVAERIKIQAKEKGTSVKKLLENCNLGVNTVTKMSAGTDIVSQNLLRIADCLNCSVDYLLGRTNNPNLFTDDLISAGDINNISNSNVGAIGNRGTVNINTVSETDGQDVFSNQFIEAFNALDLMDKVEVINFTLSKMKK